MDAKALAKQILPPGVIVHLRAARTLPVRQWPLYWKVCALGALQPVRARVIRSILFVCQGNVIRSPLAAALLQRCLSAPGSASIAIASAGLRASPGEPADPRARSVAEEFCVSLEDHRAQLVAEERVRWADVIVPMEALAAGQVLAPGLEELLAHAVGTRRLRATVSSEEAVAETDAALICVGTPSRSDGSLDVSAVEHVAHGIGRALRHRASAYTVILRSTVLPGTTERVLVPALSDGAGHPLDGAIRGAVNPEFMREGSSLRDFAEPPFG